MVDVDAAADVGVPVKRAWLLLAVFTLSIFLSAFLLFSVQPMFTKLVLPLLGGSSSVWNTAMVFFQAMLLGGYIYAHLISKYLKLGWQVVCHTAVLSSGLFFLPLAIASGWTPPVGGAQAFWMIGLFAVSVGVPFFAISANAPLLQRWFSRTDDKDADDPYFLYAASNVGSLLSLCLYPVLFEPMLKLQTQTQSWAMGYAALIGVILLAGIVAVRRPRTDAEAIEAAATPTPTSVITGKTRLFWIFLAFIPSSLMLGVTTFMATTIASVPFLWIVPLALYLLTFIIVFAKKPIVTTQQLSRLFPWVILVAIAAGFAFKKPVLPLILISLICYFLIALMSHSRLADSRPDASHLTEFYIWMSVGGVLGGLFNALIAPMIFNGVHEYILVLAIANFIVPVAVKPKGKTYTLMNYVVFVFLPTWIIFILALNDGFRFYFGAVLFGCVLTGGLAFMFGRKRAMGAGFALLVGFIIWGPILHDKPILSDRSFYSVLRVTDFEKDFGTVRVFQHGDTLHGMQIIDEGLRTTPVLYYGEGNTFDVVLKTARAQKEDLNVSVIGLGVGGIACYERPGDTWHYMEIDQAVVDMAMNPKYYTFMQECSAEKNVIVGDGRLTMSQLPEQSQDLIMLDAFSSNSIPAHLLTTGAMEIYKTYLAKDGLMFFHTSHRSMDVSSVVVKTANAAGLDAKFISLRDFKDQKFAESYTASWGVLVGPKAALERATADLPEWVEPTPSPLVKAWTDDYSSIIGPLWSGLNSPWPKDTRAGK